MDVTTGVTSSSSVVPSEVNWIGRLMRSNRVMPNSLSSFRRWVVTVGWPNSSVRAALDTLRSRAT